jgi:hypothetical protein
MHLCTFQILDLFDLSYEIFEPFLQFREHLASPSPAGDSPLDFIANPYRAGPLYMEPRDVAEVVVLRWIARAREFMVAGDFKPDTWVSVFLQPNIAFQRDSRGTLQILKYCGPSLKILDELATLDLRKICDQISDDKVHKELHGDSLWGHGVCSIVDWLQVAIIHTQGM